MTRRLCILLVILLLLGCSGREATGQRGGEQVWVLPDDRGLSGGDGSPALSLLRSAARTIALEMYLLTDDDMVDELCAARAAGKDVTVVLETAPFRAEGANQPAYGRLAAAGVDVFWASARFPLTHAKLLILDQRQVAVMTSNFTRAGLTTNREYVVVSDDAADVADAVAIVTADRTGGREPPLSGRLFTSPGSARRVLTALIEGARRRLDVQMEELSDGAMVAALSAATQRGVAVTVVAPARDWSPATNGALGRLAVAGVAVRVTLALAVHAKAIVADEIRFYVGSMNLTVSSLDTNREVGLIVDDPAGGIGARRISSVIAEDAARGQAP